MVRARALLTYEHTEDIFAVQLQLGHKDRKTTGGYIAQIQGKRPNRRLPDHGVCPADHQGSIRLMAMIHQQT
jgi:hypothetical protein